MNYRYCYRRTKKTCPGALAQTVAVFIDHDHHRSSDNMTAQTSVSAKPKSSANAGRPSQARQSRSAACCVARRRHKVEPRQPATPAQLWTGTRSAAESGAAMRTSPERPARIMRENHVQPAGSFGKTGENRLALSNPSSRRKALVSLALDPYTGRRRRGRVVEGTPLLRVQTGNRLEGSNPFVSATTIRFYYIPPLPPPFCILRCMSGKRRETPADTGWTSMNSSTFLLMAAVAWRRPRRGRMKGER